MDDENIKLHPLPLHLNFKKNFNKRYDLVVLDYYWSFNLYSMEKKGALIINEETRKEAIKKILQLKLQKKIKKQFMNIKNL